MNAYLILAICANLYYFYGPIVINGPNKRGLSNARSLASLVVGHVSWFGPGAES